MTIKLVPIFQHFKKIKRKKEKISPVLEVPLCRVKNEMFIKVGGEGFPRILFFISYNILTKKKKHQLVKWQKQLQSIC